jgi:hypothetical protein
MSVFAYSIGDGYEPTLVASTNLGDLVEIKIRDKGTEIYRRERNDVHDIIVKHSMVGQYKLIHSNGEFAEIGVTLSRTAASLPKQP